MEETLYERTKASRFVCPAPPAHRRPLPRENFTRNLEYCLERLGALSCGEELSDAWRRPAEELCNLLVPTFDKLAALTARERVREQAAAQMEEELTLACYEAGWKFICRSVQTKWFARYDGAERIKIFKLRLLATLRNAMIDAYRTEWKRRPTLLLHGGRTVSLSAGGDGESGAEFWTEKLAPHAPSAETLVLRRAAVREALARLRAADPRLCIFVRLRAQNYSRTEACRAAGFQKLSAESVARRATRILRRSES